MLNYIAMKSAQINRYGSSEVIEINQNTPEPTLSSGKVLVSIKANETKTCKV
jgi:alcohol dehydrogenase